MHRIGVLGGTFNPIHFGHLAMAQAALAGAGLDEILFVPALIPPHKTLCSSVTPEDRVAMVKLAIAPEPRFRLSTIELERKGPSYTVDTLHQLRDANPDAAFSFIMGFDSFTDLGTWHRYPELFTLADIIVCNRSGGPEAGWLSLLPVAVQGEFCYASKPDRLLHISGTSVFFLSDFRQPVSSTDVRSAVSEGAPVADLIPPAVAHYISSRKLYQPPEREPLH